MADEPMPSETLFEIPQEDFRKAVFAKRDRLNQIRLRLAKNLAERKALRPLETQAEADLMTSLDGGIQTEMESLVLPEATGASLGPASASLDDLRSQRRQDAQARAIIALRACGGQTTNVNLAAMLGINPHGLEGLLRGSDRVKKVNTGRMGNEQTNWVLVNAEGA